MGAGAAVWLRVAVCEKREGPDIGGKIRNREKKDCMNGDFQGSCFRCLG